MTSEAHMTMLTMGPDLTFPADVVTQTLVVYGGKGMGKTNLGTVLAEELSAKHLRFSVLDPLGVFWGLRHAADGRGPGIEVLMLGGIYGDIPIEPTGGAVVADLVADEEVDTVIDISRHPTGTMWSQGERIRFVADYCTRLYQRQGERRRPLMQIIDESARYCLSADTELLTDHGWIRYGDIRPGTLAVAFDLATEEYRYEPIQRVMAYRYDGPMISLHTTRLDCLVTPEHRVVLRRSQRAVGRQYKLYPWTFCRAEQTPTIIIIPGGGAPTGPGIDGLDVDILRILGWIITDGFLHDRRKSRTLCISQGHTTTKRGRIIWQEMAKLFEHYGAKCYNRTRTTKFSHGAISTGTESVWYLGSEFSAYIGKWLDEDIHRIPRRLLEGASHEQLSALYEGLMEGDGTSERERWTKFYPGHNEALADDFQELTLRIGVSSTKIQVATTRQWAVLVTDRRTHSVRRPKSEEYHGTVWDITLPSGAFVVRRNGRPFVTGNCPQLIPHGSPDVARCAGAVSTMVEEGRNAGIGVTLITQRSARMNKSVSELAECMVAFRTVGPLSIDAVVDWFGEHVEKTRWKGLVEQLRTLSRGQALVVSPGWLDFEGLVNIRQRRTFDSSATPTAGEQRHASGPGAKPDLAKYQSRMAETIERAKTADPKALRQEIARLQVELESKVGLVPPAVTPLEVSVLQDVHVARLEAITENLRTYEERIKEHAAMLTHTIAQRVEAMARLTGGAKDELEQFVRAHAEQWEEQRQVLATAIFSIQDAMQVARDREPTGHKSLLKARAAEIRASDAVAISEMAARGQRPAAMVSRRSGDGNLDAAQRAFLTIMAQRGRSRPIERDRLAVWAGYKSTSKHVDHVISSLRTRGLAEGGRDSLVITPQGIKELGDYELLPTGQALLDNWLSRLEEAPSRMLRELVRISPKTIDRDTLAERTNYSVSSKHVDHTISKLRTLELAEGPRDALKASEILMERVRS